MKDLENLLIDYCKKYSGRYINNLNRSSAPNATTYSHEFCNGCADLVRLYNNNKIFDTLKRFSEKLIENKITSCRGSEMTRERVKYLHKRFLLSRLRLQEYCILNTLLPNNA